MTFSRQLHLTVKISQRLCNIHHNVRFSLETFVIKVMSYIGCTTNPGTKNKYCVEHKHLQQPCVSSNSLDKASVKLLNNSRNQKSATIGDDSVFVIEGSSHNIKVYILRVFIGVLDSENRCDGRYLLIKWESYGVSTWYDTVNPEGYLKKLKLRNFSLITLFAHYWNG